MARWVKVLAWRSIRLYATISLLCCICECGCVLMRVRVKSIFPTATNYQTLNVIRNLSCLVRPPCAHVYAGPFLRRVLIKINDYEINKHKLGVPESLKFPVRLFRMDCGDSLMCQSLAIATHARKRIHTQTHLSHRFVSACATERIRQQPNRRLSVPPWI